MNKYMFALIVLAVVSVLIWGYVLYADGAKDQANDFVKWGMGGIMTFVVTFALLVGFTGSSRR